MMSFLPLFHKFRPHHCTLDLADPWYLMKDFLVQLRVTGKDSNQEGTLKLVVGKK